MSQVQVYRLTPDTVHEINREVGLPVAMLMSMLANAEEFSLEYHIVKPDIPADMWEPGEWWRVLNAYGDVVSLFPNKEDALKVLMDGYTLQRTYRTKSQSEWRKVS